MSDKPNPGSKEAVDQGCICPVMDNGHGSGAYSGSLTTPFFWVNHDCPLHGKVFTSENDQKEDATS